MAITRSELIEALASIGVFGAAAEGLLDGALGVVSQAANVAEIAVPATATPEDVALKVNELIQALVASGAMAAA
ncbi:hypothetical protein D3C84_605960 [compost metagenome]